MTAMTGPKISSGRAILRSLSMTKVESGRRSSTRWAKNPASRKNTGIRQMWMKSNTRNSSTDWSSSAGHAASIPPRREK